MIRTLIAIVAITCCGTTAARAQSDERASLAQSARLPVDRNAAAILANADSRLNRGESAAAIAVLQQLLNEGEAQFTEFTASASRQDADVGTSDSEFINNDGSTFESLPAAANRRLDRLSEPQRELYERQFGAIARQTLEAARRSGQLAEYRDVIMRFRNTRAGLQALRELAAVHFDHRRYGSAAAGFRRILAHPGVDPRNEHATAARLVLSLLLADQTAQARDELRLWKPLLDRQTVRTAAREVSLTEWLTGMLDGAPMPAQVAGLPTMQAVWRHDVRAVTDPPEAARTMNEVLDRVRKRSIPDLCAMRPLVVAGTVVAKTLDGVVALEAKSGTVVWPQNGLATGGQADVHLLNLDFRALYAQNLSREIQADSLSGILTSDGRSVFSVRGHVSPDDSRKSVESENPQLRFSNRLAALDVSNGDTRWELDGRRPWQNASFEDVFFLGAPQSYDGELLLVGQTGTELRLIALSPTHGGLLWSVHLAGVDRLGGEASGWRVTACPVTVRDGIAVCPTAAGAVVAVDLLSRRLLWAYRYRRDDLAANPLNQAGEPARKTLHRWWDSWREVNIAIEDTPADVVGRSARENVRGEPEGVSPRTRADVRGLTPSGSPAIDELRGAVRLGGNGVGRIQRKPVVVLASPESRRLHVLERDSGRQLWTRPQDEAVFVAGVFPTDTARATTPQREASPPTTNDSSSDEATNEAKLALSSVSDQVVQKPLNPRRRAGGGAESQRESRDRDSEIRETPASVVLVVEKYHVLALDPTTGHEVWKTPIHTPSGRGFGSAGHYYVPMSTGDVARIAIADGSFRQSFSLSKEAPGNLVPFESSVLSLTHAGISLLPELDAVRQSTERQRDAHPNDPEAARAAASLQFEAGDFAAATDTLRGLPPEPALAAEPANSTAAKRILSRQTALLHELDARPNRWKEISDELLPPSEGTDEWITLWHAVARAARKAGQSKQALDSYFQLLETNPSADSVNLDRPERSVRYDRRVQGEVADLLASVDAAAAAELEAEFQSRLQRAKASQDPFALQRLSDQLSHLPWGQSLRVKYPAESRIGLSFLKTQLNLLELTGAGDRILAASACRQLAELMTNQRCVHDSAAAYRRLRDEFADVIADDGRPASAILETLPADSSLTAEIQDGPQDVWPRAAPKITAEDRQNSDVYFYRVPVAAERGSLLDRLSVYLERNGKTVRLQGDGQQGYWDVPLPEAKSPFRYVFGMHRGWGVGQLLLLRIGTELFAIAPLDELGEPNAKLIWWLNTYPELRNAEARTRPSRIGFGPGEVVLTDEFEQPVNQVGPVRPGYVCSLQRNQLAALDTSTGARLWQRQDVDSDAVVTGDDEFVLICSEDRRRIEVLRALDGKTLATRTLPQPSREVLFVESRSWILEERLAPGQHSATYYLEKHDLITGQKLWQRQFAEAAIPFAIDVESFGVLEPSGLLHVISKRTGETVASTEVERPTRLTEIHCTFDEFRIYVALSEPIENLAIFQVRQIREDRNPLVNGWLYAFDRHDGISLWKRKLTDCGFSIDQPKEVPFLVLSYQTTEATGPGTRKTLSILRLIDKTTGADLFQHTSSSGYQFYLLEANAPQSRVDIHTPKTKFRVDYAPPKEPSDENRAQQP